MVVSSVPIVAILHHHTPRLRVENHGGILGELIPRMMWSAAALRCVEVFDFIDFYKIDSKKYEVENGFEIRYAFNFGVKHACGICL